MLFNSYDFLFVFLPLTLGSLWLCRWLFPQRAAIWLVGIASLVFYSAWNVAFLPVLLSSTLFNFLIGRRIAYATTPTRRHRWLVAGVSLNLAVLGYFKYTGFLLGNLAAITGAHLPSPHIVLPIGISFFTFTQIAFLIDVYRGRYPHLYSIADYTLFVSFFPHLIAGPILIHKTVIPQFESHRFGLPSVRVAYAGLVFICCGLFKKAVVADGLAPQVKTLYDAAASLTTPEAWLAALDYTLQLYFDFSGYSDIAFGLALLMNVRIPLNFISPYQSTSMIEFWRRWHTSLSRFLRDYLYIPLGGNRLGRKRQMANLLMTMTLAGLWHGAGWTYVVWGAMHGIMLVINHLWRALGCRLPRLAGWAVTFLSVTVAWVCFRANGLHDALKIIAAMAGLPSVPYGPPIYAPFTIDPFTDLRANLPGSFMWTALLIAWCALMPGVRWWAFRRRPSILAALVFAVLLVISVVYVARPTEFLYFQF